MLLFTGGLAACLLRHFPAAVLVRRLVRDLAADTLMPVLLGTDRPLFRKRVLHLCQNSDAFHLIEVLRIIRCIRYCKLVFPCASGIRVRIVPGKSCRKSKLGQLLSAVGVNRRGRFVSRCALNDRNLHGRGKVPDCRGQICRADAGRRHNAFLRNSKDIRIAAHPLDRLIVRRILGDIGHFRRVCLAVFHRLVVRQLDAGHTDRCAAVDEIERKLTCVILIQLSEICVGIAFFHRVNV